MALFKRALILAATAILLASPASAQHILKLMDGRILKGEFISASGGAVNFKVVGDEAPTRFEVSKILSVVFSTATPASAQKQREPISIPAGRVISIQISEEVSTITASAGQKFFGTLVADFVHEDKILVATGKRVTGRVHKVLRPKRSVDKAIVEITLIEIPVDGKTVHIITDWAGIVSDGKGTTTTTGPAMVSNSVIGELVDGNHVRFPVGARIEFRLSQPLSIRPPLN
jgi:hypothetical protein